MIIDFETMSKKAVDCAVIDCSIIIFEWDKCISSNPYTTNDINKTKRFKLSVKDQVRNYNRKIDESTIQFWDSQKPEVKKKILPKKDDLTVKEFTKQFLQELSNHKKIDYWWSRSNTFDPIILNRLFDSQNLLPNLEEYLKFWRVRDTRTWIDAKLDFPKVNGFVPIQDTNFWKKVFKEHDSSWDVLADVLRMQAIIRAEYDLPMVKK